MAKEDKTVFDGSEMVPENGETLYDAGATVGESDSTVSDDVTVPDENTVEAVKATETPSIEKGISLLDTYRVESKAIEGGMGKVWRVRHKGWNTDLAMKQPKESLFQTEQQKENFVHECEAWISLGLHPHIVSCYYVREIGGTPTIFSEWMDGGSLKDGIESGSLYGDGAAERLLDIAIQFARGLHYAHEQGLIHQDVKPDNLLLTKEGDAKVADFGIAKARATLTVLDANVPADATMFSVAGGYTPAYCSMEQMNGEQLTRRTDIYSWAVSVMEMYLGERPWANGVIAGAACERYFPNAKVAIPENMNALLKDCMNESETKRPHDFEAVEKRLLEIYQEVTGNEYPRPVSKAAADTADSLNNRALSFIDLGKTEEAEKCWEKALTVSPAHAEAFCNRTHHYWRMGKLEKARKVLMEPNFGGVKKLHTDTADAIDAAESQGGAKCLKHVGQLIGETASVYINDAGTKAVTRDNNNIITGWDLTAAGGSIGSINVSADIEGDAHSIETDFACFLSEDRFACFVTVEWQAAFDNRMEASQEEWRRNESGDYGDDDEYQDTSDSDDPLHHEFRIYSLNSTIQRIERINIDDMFGFEKAAGVSCDASHVLYKRFFMRYIDEEGWTAITDYVVYNVAAGEVVSGADTIEECDFKGRWRLQTDPIIPENENIRYIHRNGGLFLVDEATGQMSVICPYESGVGRFAWNKRDKTILVAHNGQLSLFENVTPDPVPWHLSGITSTAAALDKATQYHIAMKKAETEYETGRYAEALEAIEQCYSLWEYGDAVKRRVLNAKIGRYCIAESVHSVTKIDAILSPEWQKRTRFDGRLKLEPDFDTTSVKVVDTASVRTRKVIKKGLFGFVDAVFLPSGDRLITRCDHIYSESELRLYTVSGKFLTVLYYDKDEKIRDLCVSPDNKTVYAVTNEKLLKWNLDALPGYSVEASFPNGFMSAVNITTDGRFLLIGSLGSQLRYYRLSTSEFIQEQKLKSAYGHFTFAENGREFYKWEGRDPGQGYEIDWKYTFPGWADWDEGARPYLDLFLARHPRWTDNDFDGLIDNLQNRGYGWLRPEGVKAKLKEMRHKR